MQVQWPSRPAGHHACLRCHCLREPPPVVQVALVGLLFLGGSWLHGLMMLPVTCYGIKGYTTFPAPLRTPRLNQE